VNPAPTFVISLSIFVCGIRNEDEKDSILHITGSQHKGSVWARRGGGLFLALVGISVLDVEKGDLAEDVVPEEGHTLKVEPSTHGSGDTPDGKGGEASQKKKKKKKKKCQSLVFFLHVL